MDEHLLIEIISMPQVKKDTRDKAEELLILSIEYEIKKINGQLNTHKDIK